MINKNFLNNFLKVLLVLLILIAIIGVCIFIYAIFTDTKIEQIFPFLNKKEKTRQEFSTLFTEETYPKVDGSTATIPLSESYKKAFTGDSSATVKHNTTHNAYVNLINKDVDLILVTSPSDEELKLAKEANIGLNVEPVVNEGFVFFVNEKNPVQSLTVEQIQKIYSGEITNWKDVGGDDAEIKAYQREPNSGSQTGMISLVMKNKKLMEAPKEDIIEGMMAILGVVSDYDNGKYSIGYSYYYYTNTMYDDIDSNVVDRIRLLKVNGVEPNDETIKNGTYPFRTNYYIVTNTATDSKSEIQKLKNAMLSDIGQQIAKEAGYVPLR